MKRGFELLISIEQGLNKNLSRWLGNVSVGINNQSNTFTLIVISMRPKQWIKNFLIFLPFIFGMKLFALPTIVEGIIAFFLFSLVASAGYLLNDIMDFENDNIHPTKRLRPIASGKISKALARTMVFSISSFSIISSFVLDTYFGLVVIAYLVFHILYTKILKNAVIIDVFCLGGFSLLRVIAGCVVAKVVMSHWIIFMTVLLALFLGFNKRRQELNLLGRKATAHRTVLMKYNTYFIDRIVTVITSSIVVVYMLYTVDARTVDLFGSKNLIYSIPFVYYGIFHYLFLLHRKSNEGDPTRILLSDKKMQLNIVLWIIVCVAVIYFKL